MTFGVKKSSQGTSFFWCTWHMVCIQKRSRVPYHCGVGLAEGRYGWGTIVGNSKTTRILPTNLRRFQPQVYGEHEPVRMRDYRGTFTIDFRTQKLNFDNRCVFDLARICLWRVLHLTARLTIRAGNVNLGYMNINAQQSTRVQNELRGVWRECSVHGNPSRTAMHLELAPVTAESPWSCKTHGNTIKIKTTENLLSYISTYRPNATFLSQRQPSAHQLCRRSQGFIRYKTSRGFLNISPLDYNGDWTRLSNRREIGATSPTALLEKKLTTLAQSGKFAATASTSDWCSLYFICNQVAGYHACDIRVSSSAGSKCKTVAGDCSEHLKRFSWQTGKTVS